MNNIKNYRAVKMELSSDIKNNHCWKEVTDLIDNCGCVAELRTTNFIVLVIDNPIII
jgi:hypothetical protein